MNEEFIEGFIENLRIKAVEYKTEGGEPRSRIGETLDIVASAMEEAVEETGTVTVYL